MTIRFTLILSTNNILRNYTEQTAITQVNEILYAIQEHDIKFYKDNFKELQAFIFDSWQEINLETYARRLFSNGAILKLEKIGR